MRAALSLLPPLWLLGMSLVALCLMGFDKGRARRGGRRVRERTLWLCALLGGAPGAALGMLAFRHKTRHTAFRLGLPLLAAAELLALGAWWLSRAEGGLISFLW